MHYHNLICVHCYGERVPPARAKLGFRTCLTCGEKLAKASQGLSLEVSDEPGGINFSLQ